MGFLLSVRLSRLWQTGTLPGGDVFLTSGQILTGCPVSTPGKDGSMVHTALLALVLALGGGGSHFGVLLDLASAVWETGPADAMTKAGNHADPNGAPATGDAGGVNDPNGAGAKAGNVNDPNG
jgi:hypothetical protein